MQQLHETIITDIKKDVLFAKGGKLIKISCANNYIKGSCTNNY